MGPLRALTGPVERGDRGTIATHLRALANAPVPESVKALYRAAGLHALNMARRKKPGADLVTIWNCYFEAARDD